MHREIFGGMTGCVNAAWIVVPLMLRHSDGQELSTCGTLVNMKRWLPHLLAVMSLILFGLAVYQMCRGTSMVVMIPWQVIPDTDHTRVQMATGRVSLGFSLVAEPVGYAHKARLCVPLRPYWHEHSVLGLQFGYGEGGFTESVVRLGLPPFSGMRFYSGTRLAMPTLLALPMMFAFPMFVWIRMWRIGKRRCQGKCTRCGYDLRATPNRCSECGQIPAAAKACSTAAKVLFH